MSVVAIEAKSKFKPETVEFMIPFLPKPIFDQQIQAQNQLKAQGIPTQKLESWGFSNLPLALKKLGIIPSSVPQISIDNGLFTRGMPDWAQEYFRTANANEPTLITMTTATLGDIYTIDIKPNTDLENSIAINWKLLGAETVHFIIRIQKNSSATISEIQDGVKGLRMGRLIIILEDGAILNHSRVMNDDSETVALQTIDIYAARDSVYNGFILNKGGAFSRTELNGNLQGSNAEITFNGLQLQAQTQFADTSILINHEQPHGRSNQFYKTILADQAVGVFQGKIHVHQIAQKTDGYQMSNAVLLSQGATMYTKPQLEIYADDVKCSHGTTTGQLDETPLFYLCSRGISEFDARRLLLQSACGEVIDKISDDQIKEMIADEVADWLNNLYES